MFLNSSNFFLFFLPFISCLSAVYVLPANSNVFVCLIPPVCHINPPLTASIGYFYQFPPNPKLWGKCESSQLKMHKAHWFCSQSNIYLSPVIQAGIFRFQYWVIVVNGHKYACPENTTKHSHIVHLVPHGKQVVLPPEAVIKCRSTRSQVEEQTGFKPH